MAAEMQGVLRLETSEFQRNLGDAVKASQYFSRQIQSTATSTQTAFRRMFESFRGDKLIKEASTMAEAIQKIGGVSKLTQSELQRVQAVMGEAAQKARLMGVDMPAAFKKVSAEVSGTTSIFQRMGASVASIATGFVAAQLGINLVSKAFSFVKGAAIDMNASLEKSTLQFTTLMGDADRAQKHVKALFEFAKRTPFETGPIIEASKKLQTFGGDALNTMQNLKLLGDASAATGAPIEELGFWVGRLYAMLKGGKPFGEAALRLQELAVLTPEARDAMEELQKKFAKTGEAAAHADEIFGVFTESLGRYTGAMEAQASTWEGLTSTLIETLQLAIAEGLRPFFTETKNVIQQLNEFLTSDEAQRGIAEWSQAFGRYLKQSILEAEMLFIRIQQGIYALVAGLNRILPAPGVGDYRAAVAEAEVARLQAEFERKRSEMQELLSPRLESKTFDPFAAAVKRSEQLLLLPRPPQLTPEEQKEVERVAKATQDLIRKRALATATVPASLFNLGGLLTPTFPTFGQAGFLGAGKFPFSTSRTELGVPLTRGLPAQLPGTYIGFEPPPPKPSAFQSLFGAGFAPGLASTVLKTFMGGGNVGQAIGGFSVGALLGEGSKLGGLISGGLTKALGSTIGGALGSIIPGLGTLLGGALGGLLGKLFGGESKQTRQMRDQWLQQAGGLDEVRKMADYAGVSIDKLLSTKKTKTFEAEVKKLEAAFAAAQKRVQSLVTDLETLAKKGGLVSGDLAKRLTKDLDKPEVQQAFQQFVTTNLEQAATGLTTFLQVAKDLPLSAKSAEALGAALAGVFERSKQLGLSARDALKLVQPALDALAVRLEAAGLSGGAAFDQLRQMAGLLTGELTGPLLEGIDGLTQAMVGLANAGLLTEDMFAGLAEQVGQSYQALVQQGVSAEDALRAIAPALQRVWELQQKYGWAVDDATQALIDQGVEAGLVGDHMKDVMSQVLDVLKAIAKVLGADIPDAAGRAADAMGRVRPPEGWGGGGGRGREEDRVQAYWGGSGGVQDFGAGTMAMLHGREAVLTEAQLKSLLESRGGSGPTVHITIQALDTQSVRQAVEQDIGPALVEVLRQNVRGMRTDTQYALGVRG